MCIIVDANVLGTFLGESPSKITAPIHKWLRKKRGKLIYSTGGRFANDIGRGTRDRLAVYAQAGMAIEVKGELLIDEERMLEGRIKSDDPHVLALARASGARLLYTADRDLMSDFKNGQLIEGPRGKVYTRRTHARLLTGSVCAPS